MVPEGSEKLFLIFILGEQNERLGKKGIES